MPASNLLRVHAEGMTARQPIQKLTKAGLVTEVAALTGLTVRESRAVVHTVITGISRELIAGHPVHLPGVGTFTPRPTAPRLGVHPGTSRPLVVPARKKVAFSAAGSLKAALLGDSLTEQPGGTPDRQAV